MIRITSLLVAMLLATSTLFAETWEIDKAHTNIGFQVRHMVVSKVKGQFNEFSGTINFDGKDFATATVEVTINPKSINTSNDYRDKDLRSPSFFNTDSLPEMKFVSTKIVPKGDNKFEMTGNLTMHGQTHPVTLQGEFNGVIAMKDGAKAGFSARTTINRQDWGLKWHNTLPTGELVVSDEVEISLEVEANRKP